MKAYDYAFCCISIKPPAMQVEPVSFSFKQNTSNDIISVGSPTTPNNKGGSPIGYE